MEAASDPPNDGSSIKFTEWSPKAMRSISFRKFGSVWMVNMAGKLMAAQGEHSYILKANDMHCAFLAQRCANEAGRYVSIVQYGEGRRRGVIVVPEGVGGEGWRLLAGLFQEVVEHLGRIKEGRNGKKIAGQVWLRGGHSFAEVVKEGKSLVVAGKQALVDACVGGKGKKVALTLQTQKKHADQATFQFSKALVKDRETVALMGDSRGLADFRKRLLDMRVELDKLISEADGLLGRGRGWGEVDLTHNGPERLLMTIGPETKQDEGPLLRG